VSSKLCSQQLRPTRIALKGLTVEEIDAQKARPIVQGVVEQAGFASTTGPEQKSRSPFL